MVGELLTLLDAVPLQTALHVACHVGTLLTSYARVYLHYHTTSQVLAGLAVGYVVGMCWRERFIHPRCKW